MKLEECLNIIDKVLSEELLFTKLISHTSAENFKNIFIRVNSHIRKLKNDETDDYLLITPEEIKDSFYAIKDILIEKPVNNITFNFVNAWSMLIKNWINNISQVEDFSMFDFSEIEPLIVQCSMLSENFLTMKQTVEILKRLNMRLNRFIEWTPPAFEINKNFIKYLDEEDPICTEDLNCSSNTECQPENEGRSISVGKASTECQPENNDEDLQPIVEMME